ncbi:multifunctional complex type dihydroorotase [Tepidicaulis marinus]|uniref:Dihydroorotase n=1 Tax=Tepidicaulis marinus TaxID=1333998 RepID=A0A081B822_9HYPH|nr:dihydroorotase [Tepidicaulis marinus]GAK44190.1 multifunctional complex type dihydroorotase [Tepidicaulis marinus]
MSRTALINARLVDPASGLDEQGALLIEDGKIADFGAALFKDAVPEGIEVIDCGGHVLTPGLIDMHVFTGEPGNEHRETLGSATQAAAAGGVTTIIVMPNTEPAIDDVALVDFIKRRARDTGLVHVHPMAALTKGLKGEQMAEMGLLKEAGAVAFTDADHTLENAQVMRRAMSYSTYLDALIVNHAAEPSLARGGVMNEGELASRLGLAGIPKAAETIIIERDIRLVEMTGARYHVSQVSTADSVDVIRRAKARGLPVTCGASACHLTLNENDVGNYLTFCKLDPPLRSEDDRRAVVAGVADGTVDVIVSAHDPQDPETKRLPFALSAFGAVGLETLLPATLSLVHNGDIELAAALRALTCHPADLLGLETGRLGTGMPADLTLIDMGVPWVLDRYKLKSKSKNSPYDERRLQGRAIRTIVNGKSVYVQGEDV